MGGEVEDVFVCRLCCLVVVSFFPPGHNETLPTVLQNSNWKC